MIGCSTSRFEEWYRISAKTFDSSFSLFIPPL